MSLAAVVFMAACSSAKQNAAARVDEIMHAYQGSVPGASVMVLRDGIPVFRRSYGMADLEHAVAATPAPYPTALAIAMIFEPAADATRAATSVVGPDSAARPLPASRP